MAESAWRFRPPRTELTPELRWVLLRAFGPPRAAPGGFQAHAAVDLAGAMALGGRIAARQERGALADELGAELAGRLQGWRMASAARALQIENALADVAAVAAEQGFRIVPLKGAALALAAVTITGARSAQDLDLLLAPQEARRLFSALEDRGYRSSGSGEHEHQLPTLVHPRGIALELHLKVLGVRLSGGGSATLDDLERAGLLVAIETLPGRVSVPGCALLAAHALVHALVQHGWTPDAYPLGRVLADLQDLDWPRRDAALQQQVHGWLARDLSALEIEGASELVARLSEGDLTPFKSAPEASAAASLAHHLVAGPSDEDYRRALRFKMVGWPLSDLSTQRRLATWLRGALWPSRAELDALFGPARGPLGRIGQRLRRPFHLAGRAAGHAWAWARRRAAGRSHPRR